MSSWYDSQLKNKNYLSPIGFLFILEKARKVSFLCQSAEIPTMSISEIVVPTPGFVQLPLPDGQATFANLELQFIVDENLENYMKIHNWLTGLGYPETTQQYKDLTTDGDGVRDPKEAFSDGNLHILNSNYRDIAIVKFNDLFPVFLTPLEFTATETDINYFTAEVTFKYTVYNVVAADGRTPL